MSEEWRLSNIRYQAERMRAMLDAADALLSLRDDLSTETSRLSAFHLVSAAQDSLDEVLNEIVQFERAAASEPEQRIVRVANKVARSKR